MNVIELIGTILIFVVIIAILILAFIPSKCPKCGGKMKDIQIENSHIVYKCENCGTNFIVL